MTTAGIAVVARGMIGMTAVGDEAAGQAVHPAGVVDDGVRVGVRSHFAGADRVPVAVDVAAQVGGHLPGRGDVRPGDELAAEQRAQVRRAGDLAQPGAVVAGSARTRSSRAAPAISEGQQFP
jgi:hypothetical protein